ncbi:LOW QUALITY PROTEIN: reticulocalbin-3-like, partial [Pelecanus crispus]|uniref:LOW QUALITY PROTEIN: reticulocalbin-3-like n=1 Tax=Pelecanus crispus TaxID=36300 RepID=UPI003F5D2D4C
RGPRRDLAGVSHDHRDGFAYDHEAFLGPEEARAFDQLSPEESQRRLGPGGLGGVWGAVGGPGGLGAWIERTQRRARDESLRQGWQRYDRDGDGVVTWDEYRREAYGPPEDDFGGTQHPEAYRRMLARDERRFRAADGDGDGGADRDEFAAFLHPEDFERMRPLVTMETMEDMDKDGDGFIQEDEYIAPLTGAPEPLAPPMGAPEPPGPSDGCPWPPAPPTGAPEPLAPPMGAPGPRPPAPPTGAPEPPAPLTGTPSPQRSCTRGAPGAPEPEWVREERAQFGWARDRDGDGRLDAAEVGHWLQPPSPDWAGVEAAHLLHHSDSDKDGRLRRAEILGRWQLFVGSQATNYGQDLQRPHDEL